MPTLRRNPRLNALLAALQGGNGRHPNPGLEPVSLIRGVVLCEPDELIQHVYFPVDSLISLLVVDDGGMVFEVAVVGSEGAFGVPLALGSRVSPVRAVVRGEGEALRMGAARFRAEMKRTPSLRREVYRYINVLLIQFAQNGACSHFHEVEARLARWLLMTRDRLRTDQFYMTQERLATMVGARRIGVSVAAVSLRRQKLIAYRRGNITILDRRGLETASCGCYRVLKDRQKVA